MKNKPTHGTGGQNLPDDPEQSKRFEDTARELEADKNREKFEKVIQTIVPTKKNHPSKDSDD
jgi:hypothetical protein